MKKFICLLLIMATLFTVSCNMDDNDTDTTTAATTTTSSPPTNPPTNPPRNVPNAPESYDYAANDSVILPLRQDIYAKKGNYNLPINIFEPKVVNDNNDVAILCIHGGGWNTSITENGTFTGDWMRHQAKYYAALGFYTFEISYRSMNKGFNIKDLQSDVEDAMRYINNNLCPEFGIDRVVAIGDSAGGHLALCLALAEDESLHPFATIACNPVSNCVDVIGDEDWRGGITDPEISKTVSPLHMAKKTDGKILIMHGTADGTVNPDGSEALYDALTVAGNDTELIWLDGAEHAFILYDWYDQWCHHPKEKIDEYMKMTVEYLNRILA